MDLSVREVAALLGRSPRTVRAQLARGDLPGTKRNGRWRLERRHLPLTESQHRALQSKAETIRQAVEEVLPSRLAATPGSRSRSVVDLAAFRRGAEILAAVRAAGGDEAPPPALLRVARLLEEALLALAEAVQHFDRDLKLAALNRCRALLARAVALLLLQGPLPPAEPVLGWVSALEAEVTPAVAGFARWAEGLKRGRR